MHLQGLLKTVAIAWLVLVTLIAPSSAASSDTTEPPNVVIIIVDALRPDVLGCYGAQTRTPNIDHLAQMGTMYRCAYSTGTHTAPSCLSMLTGNYPAVYAHPENEVQINGHHVLRIPDSHVSLFEELAQRGYEVCCCLQNKIPEYANALQGVSRRLHLEKVSMEMRREVRSKLGIKTAQFPSSFYLTLDYLLHASSSQPFLLLIWILDPHAPYDPPNLAVDKMADSLNLRIKPAYYRQLKGVELKAKASELTDAEREFLKRLYIAEVEDVDRRVGLIIEALKLSDLLNHTYIVLTADHGEFLGEHGLYSHGWDVFYDCVVHVPLIYVGPKIPKGRISNVRVSHVGLIPTLADLLGVELTQPRQGKSYRSSLYKDFPSEKIYFVNYTPRASAVLDGRWKFIKRYQQMLLFDLSQDPDEVVNLVDEYPQVARRLLDEVRRLGQVIQASDLGQENRAGTSDLTAEQREELKRHLKALGYIR